MTVRELEGAGANAVQIEDQVAPKRCGHMEGKEVIPADEMVIKVRAAVSARRSDETLIIARSDALQVTGLDDTIARCNAYAEAGADLVFVDAPRTVEEVAAIAERCAVPCVANMSETGRSPTIPTEELETMGYKLVIFPSTQTWLFARAYAELCRGGRPRPARPHALLDRFTSFDDGERAARSVPGVDEPVSASMPACSDGPHEPVDDLRLRRAADRLRRGRRVGGG